MTAPKEPTNPPGTRPHRERVMEIAHWLQVGQTGAICVDVGNEEWYLHEVAKYPRLLVMDHGPGPVDGVYTIRVKKKDVEAN